MDRLEHVSTADLREHLHSVEGNRATLRLVVGINYKAGVPQSTLADWYGVSRTTIHHWLNRLERLDTEPIETVLHDAERPGRPPKLAAAERAELRSALAGPPTDVGIDAPEWTPALVKRFVREAFDVEYSRRHARTVLADLAGGRSR